MPANSIDKRLLERLPVSFASYCLDQMKDWDLLFPAEQAYFDRLFALLDRSGPEAVDRLFGPLREIERQMGVSDKNFPKGQFSLEQVDFLNRNPHYTEWRGAIAKVFAQLDPLLDAEVARRSHARLVIALAPSQLPADPGRMWTRFQDRGKRIAIDTPDRADAFLPLLLTGQERGAPTIAELFAAGKKGGPYTSWIVEAGSDLSRIGSGTAPVVKYSYQALEPYRQRLMKEVQGVVDTQEVPGPRQLSARLKQMKILASEGGFAADPILAEFARAILLSGNGTLLINNTFVEWATVQAVRRARPSVSVVGFGIRNKIKPFSSLLIFADQNASNPIPSQMDTLGSYVDLEVFWQYIWQEYEKYAEFRNNTAYLFAGDGMEEMLVIAPQDFPLLSAQGSVKLPAVFAATKEWLNL
ncbi:MAG TPA: hypothetical protein VKU19_21345 [Bryobacteraceae bacterium]|nr:hypothetical protein [Bryobacteraceae bacterium]